MSKDYLSTIEKVRRDGVVLDPEDVLCLMKADDQVCEELKDLAILQGREQLRPGIEERLRLVVRHSLKAVKSRIAEAKEAFRSLCPGVRIFTFRCSHLDEETLFRYFTGRITRREKIDLECECRYCPECGWQLVGVGQAVRSFAVMANCDHLISPAATRVFHFEADEVEAWLTGAMSREKKKELLDHLKVCRCCRALMRDKTVSRSASPDCNN